MSPGPADSAFRVGVRRYDLAARVLVVGIVDAAERAAATRHAEQHLADGADLVHVEGPATRSSLDITDSEERGIVVPVVGALRGLGVGVSIDVSSTSVLAAACDAGATVARDPGGSADAAYLGVAARSGASLLVGLAPGAVARDSDALAAALEARARSAEAAGIAADRIALDPLGTGADPGDRAALLVATPRLRRLGYPLALGPGREIAGLGAQTDLSVDPRRARLLAAVAYGVAHGVRLVFTPDVRATVRVCRMVEAVLVASEDRPAHGPSGPVRSSESGST